MALQVKVIDKNGKAVGDTAVLGSIFDVRPREHLLFDMVQMQRASKRQGSAKTKIRSEVRGGGKKPYRQKRTGNARHGSSRSPIFTGGGQTFGPIPRDFSYRIPRKARREALRVALSQKRKEGKLFVLQDGSWEKPATAQLVKLLRQLKVEKALLVDSGNQPLARSASNLPKAKYIDTNGLNVFDILKYENLILSAASLKGLQEELKS